MIDSDKRSATDGARVPAVSIIIPAYGVNEYIEEAVDSVLAQTFTDYELYVVNDGAPPHETAELKRILARYGDRVIYLERPNGGQAAARNTAIRESRAPYIALLDGDDCWAPTLLERQMELLLADPGLALVYCDARLFGDGPTVGTTYMMGEPSYGPVTLTSLLALRCNVTMSTIVASREAVIAAGWFDESLRYVEDYDLWLRMAHRGARMTYRRDVLAYRRVRDTALSANPLKLERALLAVLERFGREMPLGETDRAVLADTIGKVRSHIALVEGKHNLSAGHFGEAARRLRQLDPAHVNLKLRVARFGLNTIPALIGFAFRIWNRLLRLRVRARSARAARRAVRP